MIASFLDPKALVADRAGWERIVAKLRAAEMPPAGVPKPPAAQMNGLLSYVQGEFERADKSTRIDPGRVTARRLKSKRYANTVRDLLASILRPPTNFPATAPVSESTI